MTQPDASMTAWVGVCVEFASEHVGKCQINVGKCRNRVGKLQKSLLINATQHTLICHPSSPIVFEALGLISMDSEIFRRIPINSDGFRQFSDTPHIFECFLSKEPST